MLWPISAAACQLERGEAGWWHVDHAPEPDAGATQVGFVFDLRQQLDFVGAGAANHGGRLSTLCRLGEEGP
jgi:hypothetical protein